MSRTAKIIIGIFIALILLLFILVGVIWYQALKDTQPQVVEPVVQVEEPTDTNANTGEANTDEFVIDSTNIPTDPVNPPAIEEASTASLRAIALSFVERFGSFSNDSDYSNIEELKVSMTVEMRIWADKFVREQRNLQLQEAEGATFYGVSTRALSTEESNVNDETGKATFLINTQRIESRGQKRETTVGYQKIRVELVKENDIWLVNSAQWQ